MKFIEEIVVDDFLPTVRSMLAEELRDRGFTQAEVAGALGISQSAVSKYAHGDVAREPAVLEDERVRDLVERIAEGLANGDVSRVQALVEIEILVRRLERGDLLAELHEEAMPELAEYDGEFHIHDPESALRESERVRSSVRRGLRILENASGFASLIPAVGSNLVECTTDPEGIEDVAGVPGRIFDVKGRVAIPSDPEFGVSEHVATVLLAARGHGTDHRAALNVRYDPATVATLNRTGHTAAEFDAEIETTAAVEAALDGRPDASVLYQTGAHGIEPIVYLLGPDAESVAETARELLPP